MPTKYISMYTLNTYIYTSKSFISDGLSLDNTYINLKIKPEQLVLHHYSKSSHN